MDKEEEQTYREILFGIYAGLAMHALITTRDATEQGSLIASRSFDIASEMIARHAKVADFMKKNNTL